MTEEHLTNLSAIASIERHPQQRLRCVDGRIIYEDRLFAPFARSWAGDSRDKVVDYLEKSVNHIEYIQSVASDLIPKSRSAISFENYLIRAQILFPAVEVGIMTMLSSHYAHDHNLEIRMLRVIERLHSIFTGSVDSE